MNNSEIKALVITPHPDDIEFGAAGSVASWIEEGGEVIYVVCTDGSKGTSDPEMPPEQLALIRRDEQIAAAKVVGVHQVIFLDYPDAGLEDTVMFRGDLVRLIRKYRPEVVVTSDPYRKYRWHRDHRITGIVTMDAVFPYARDHLSFPEQITEGLYAHKVREIYFWGSEEPNVYIDISNTFPLKLEALRCHTSQVLKDFEAERQWLEKRARNIGQSQGLHMAEAFHKVVIGN